MTIQGSCHCGEVRLTVPRAPEWVGDCNCSLCTKLGTLMAYYPDAEVSVEGETVAYIWGDKMIGIHHCPTCGCNTPWKTLGEEPTFSRPRLAKPTKPTSPQIQECRGCRFTPRSALASQKGAPFCE